MDAPTPDLEIIREDPTRRSNPCAAVYGRSSGAESKSIRDQVEIGRRRCSERSWRLRYILTDEGMSGGDPLRPGYQALWDHVEAKRIDIVVTWKIDRIARSLAEMAQLEEALRARSVALHSCTEPIDTTTAQGRFVFGILATAGQLERELGSERVRSVMTERARRGMWLHPVPPFGYCLGRSRRLRAHPSESNLVRRVFQAHAKNGSYAEAAAHLNSKGYQRRGRRWTAGTVQRIIENSIYVGHYKHWGQAVHRPNLRLVSDSDWERSQESRRRNPRVGQAASQELRRQSIKRVFDQYLAGLDLLES